MKKYSTKVVSLLLMFLLLIGSVVAQQLSDYQYKKGDKLIDNAITGQNQFNGHTYYWRNYYKENIRYGNLFKMSVPNVEYVIAQSKIDVAEDMGLPGLLLQEGFVSGLFANEYVTLDNPTVAELESAAAKGNVLVFIEPGSDAGKKLLQNFEPNPFWTEKLKSYQLKSGDLKRVDAFILESGNKKIFVVSSAHHKTQKQFDDQLQNVKKVLADYDLHKGWFGVETNYKSVTVVPGHPLELIGKGLNEGNTWFVFVGYMDFLLQKDFKNWLGNTNLPIVADVGYSPIYGCDDYDGIQIQDMEDGQPWIDFAKKKNGYIFRQVVDKKADAFHYDGFIANEGNKEQIDNENVPFISNTGDLTGDLESSMVLFTKKGDQFTRKAMWDAIMDRREVAILSQGKMMGPDKYRNVLQLLLLDRVYMEEYFGERIDIQTKVESYILNITISNDYDKAVSGKLNIVLPEGIKAVETLPASLTLDANSTKTIQVKIKPLASAMNKSNVIVVEFGWEGKKKTTLAMLDLPPAVSVNQLLYGQSPLVKFPASIHNFSSNTPFPVKVEVFEKDQPQKAILSVNQINTASLSEFQSMNFDLKLNPGDYIVKTSALGVESSSQLGVEKPKGKAFAYPIDLNSDGISEYRLENDSVQITLLATGARVIEYIVKSRKDNVLFKLWPNKPTDDRNGFRKRIYYPYGGFEDFLAQPSIETFKNFDATLIQDKGDFVQVKMVSDIYGNKIEKTYTLYGDSPLLEVRYAININDPELTMIGPQPILELGAAHGTEDVFSVPSVNGIEQYRMKPEKYYGHLFDLKEGWNAGYDEKEDISFIGAFPVNQPLFLHMWMNHPNNPCAYYYYAEFQPWVPLKMQNTIYFTYYLWGAGGKWENGVKELRARNLITTKAL